MLPRLRQPQKYYGPSREQCCERCHHILCCVSSRELGQHTIRQRQCHYCNRCGDDSDPHTKREGPQFATPIQRSQTAVGLAHPPTAHAGVPCIVFTPVSVVAFLGNFIGPEPAEFLPEIPPLLFGWAVCGWRRGHGRTPSSRTTDTSVPSAKAGLLAVAFCASPASVAVITLQTSVIGMRACDAIRAATETDVAVPLSLTTGNCAFDCGSGGMGSAAARDQSDTT